MSVPEDRPSTFRLLVVPGVTVDRWSRTWSERLPGVQLQLSPTEVAEAAALLSAGSADAGLLRLPVDPDSFHAIPLYTELTVAVVPKDHVLAAADELTVADLVDETLVRPLDDVLGWTGPEGATVLADEDRPTSTAAAVELVAAGVGVLVVPQSLARAYHRRDLTYRVVTDAPTSSVALVWGRDRHTDLVEEMIGIVRGRTANSTRGRAGEQPAASSAPARAATGGGAARTSPSSNRGQGRRGRTDPRTPPRRRGR